MLELKVFDGERDVVLQFEHSLLSLSKWEAKTRKAFLARSQRTPSELYSYFECMLLPPEDDPNLVVLINPEQMKELTDYINTSQTASSVPVDDKKVLDDETITSELIYWWLAALRIPFQPTESWHLSRTVMLVQIGGYKSQPEDKRKKRAKPNMADWMRINEERKKQYGTNG